MTDERYLPKKKRYYVISTGGQYGRQELFHLQELDAAMDLFKLLQKAEAINVSNDSIKTFLDKPDSVGDHYTYKSYHYEDTEKGGFHLESKIIDIFTKEQIKAIEKIEAKKLEEAEAEKLKAEKTEKVKKKVAKK